MSTTLSAETLPVVALLVQTAVALGNKDVCLLAHEENGDFLVTGENRMKVLSQYIEDAANLIGLAGNKLAPEKRTIMPASVLPIQRPQ